MKSSLGDYGWKSIPAGHQCCYKKTTGTSSFVSASAHGSN